MHQLVSKPAAFAKACDDARAAGKRVALVPTMGALHEGHLTLVARARERADFVAVSIFVNPTQFGPGEDLERYPRTLAEDREHCERAGVDVVFAPSADRMYAPGEQTRVEAGSTAEGLCGAGRPGHFDGVVTIVTKLLVLAGPCLAVFGRKDYQQWRVIHRLVQDLFLPVELLGVPTVREPDGLALSSRNRYLSPSQRTRALSIATGLRAAVEAFAKQERRVGVLRQLARGPIETSMDAVEYVSVCDADTVFELDDEVTIEGRALLAVAARIGETRLIENVVLGEDGPPR